MLKIFLKYIGRFFVLILKGCDVDLDVVVFVGVIVVVWDWCDVFD